MKHSWKGFYNAAGTHVTHRCQTCKVEVVRTTTDTPDDSLMQRLGIEINCDDQQVKHVMES